MYIREGFPDTKALRTGGCLSYRLISSNRCWQASSQMNETPFFINLVKGWHLPERFEINLRIYANCPCNPLSSLRFLGGCISWTAQTFSGSRWIPLDVITNPRNLPLATPRKDLVEFIFHWCARMISYTVFRSAMWSPLSQLFIAMLSTYHSTVLRICSWKIAFIAL